MHCGALKAIEQQRDNLALNGVRNLAMERMRNNLAVSMANNLAQKQAITCTSPTVRLILVNNEK